MWFTDAPATHCQFKDGELKFDRESKLGYFVIQRGRILPTNLGYSPPYFWLTWPRKAPTMLQPGSVHALVETA